MATVLNLVEKKRERETLNLDKRLKGTEEAERMMYFSSLCWNPNRDALRQCPSFEILVKASFSYTVEVPRMTKRIATGSPESTLFSLTGTNGLKNSLQGIHRRNNNFKKFL